MLKNDSKKSPLSLLPSKPLLQIADVLGFGADKYSPHGWRIGGDHSRYLSAAMRHIAAYNDGEDLDPESGLEHLAHAAASLMFVLEYRAAGLGVDDRHVVPAREWALVFLERDQLFKPAWSIAEFRPGHGGILYHALGHAHMIIRTDHGMDAVDPIDWQTGPIPSYLDAVRRHVPDPVAQWAVVWDRYGPERIEFSVYSDDDLGTNYRIAYRSELDSDPTGDGYNGVTWRTGPIPAALEGLRR